MCFSLSTQLRVKKKLGFNFILFFKKFKRFFTLLNLLNITYFSKCLKTVRVDHLQIRVSLNKICEPYLGASQT